MPTYAEVQQELANFPAILKKLIEDELAAGNEIEDIGHSFPAPPVGAYFKLRNRVSTRPRESADGLDFYERNSSQYSGQFTDAKGFFFVLEPPEPPAEEVDMDEIRRRLNAPSSDSSNTPVEPSDVTRTNDAPSDRTNETRAERSRRITASTPEGAQPFLRESTSSGQTWTMFFASDQPAHAVKEEFESITSALLQSTNEGDPKAWIAQYNNVGINYTLRLTLLAAAKKANSYEVKIDATWSKSISDSDYYRRSSSGWVDMWTNRFDRTMDAPSITNDKQLYRQQVAEVADHESAESSVEAVQQLIIAKFKSGATAGNSHKEGGTTISWTGTHFLRVDYGDNPDTKVYQSEADFLAALFQFYSWNPLRLSSPPLAELDSWRLILRKLS